MEAGHKRLEIYQMAHSLAVGVHKMTLGLHSLSDSRKETDSEVGEVGLYEYCRRICSEKVQE